MTKHDLPVLARLGEDLHRAAVREMGRPPWWRRRRVAFAVPALGAAALIAALMVPGGSGPGATERAYAAVTPGDEILHVVQEADLGAPDHGAPARMETWTDGETIRLVSDGRGLFAAGEIVFDRDGGQVTTYNIARDEIGSFPAAEDGSFAATEDNLPASMLDRVETFGQRAEEGELGPPRDDHFDGRSVVRFDSPAGRAATESWFFDADTFVPVATQSAIPGIPSQTTRYLLYERVPYDERLLEMSPHPGAERTDSPGPVTNPPTWLPPGTVLGP